MEMRACVVLVFVAMVVDAVAATTTYTVGAPDGLWDLDTEYAQWVAARTFHLGDTITFTYSPELHDVVEVTRAGYDACSSADNVSAFRTGNDAVPLPAPGRHALYFLCGLTGHCDSGMKIRIDAVVVPASSPAGPTVLPTAAGTTAAAAGIEALLLHLGVIVVAATRRLPCDDYHRRSFWKNRL